jgi:hypothetical protein
MRPPKASASWTPRGRRWPRPGLDLTSVLGASRVPELGCLSADSRSTASAPPVGQRFGRSSALACSAAFSTSWITSSLATKPRFKSAIRSSVRTAAAARISLRLGTAARFLGPYPPQHSIVCRALRFDRLRLDAPESMITQLVDVSFPACGEI